MCNIYIVEFKRVYSDFVIKSMVSNKSIDPDKSMDIIEECFLNLVVSLDGNDSLKKNFIDRCMDLHFFACNGIWDSYEMALSKL